MRRYWRKRRAGEPLDSLSWLNWFIKMLGKRRAGEPRKRKGAMGNKPTISKEIILDAACQLASEKGAGALNIRSVASRCGVAVGSVYNYYPNKSELVADAVEKFWRNSIPHDQLARAEEVIDGGFVDFCRDAMESLREPLAVFRETWLSNQGKLDVRDIKTSREREDACFRHIRAGVLCALQRDQAVDRSIFGSALSEEQLCDWIWDSIFEGLRRGDTANEALFAVLERALYGKKPRVE